MYNFYHIIPVIFGTYYDALTDSPVNWLASAAATRIDIDQRTVLSFLH